MSNFFMWLGTKRKPIGYTIGVLNLLAALSYFIQGEYSMAILWVAIGFMIIIDATEVK